MTRFQHTLAIAVTALALAAAPALAQQAGSRSAGGRPAVGTAKPRTSGTPNTSARAPRPSAPSTAGTSSSRPASPSGSAASSGARGPSAGQNQGRPAARAVPQSSRPRAGRPVVGTPQARTARPTAPRPPNYRPPTYRPPTYRPGSAWYWGSPYSHRYSYPTWSWGWGYGYPYYGAFGPGFVYNYDPYWRGSATYYGGYSYQDEYVETGKLRLRVKPREAQVFVDGYYAGIVDEFDGTFQRLQLEVGGHGVEIRLDGYSALTFDVLILPGKTITYRGELPHIP